MTMRQESYDTPEVVAEAERILAEINADQDDYEAQERGYRAWCEATGNDPDDPRSREIAVATLPRLHPHEIPEPEYCDHPKCEQAPCKGAAIPGWCAACHTASCAGIKPSCPPEAQERLARRREQIERARQREVDEIWAEAETRREAEQREERVQAALSELRGDEIVIPEILRPVRDLLAQQPAAEAYRIDRLWRMGDSVLFDAFAKAGKTVRRNEVLKCLADGGKLFGEFDVAHLQDGETVVVFDFELTEQITREWIGRLGIKHDERVFVVHLKGLAHTFDMRDPAVRQKWSKLLRDAGARVAIQDCLAPVLAALGLDENGAGVQGFLQGWEAMLKDAGVSENMVIHHQGRNGATRGHSSLEGWGGALWSLSMTNMRDPRSRRHFSVAGRVDGAGHVSGSLEFDPATGLSTYVASSGCASRALGEASDGAPGSSAEPAIIESVLGHLKDHGRSTKSAVTRSVKGNAGELRAAFDHLEETGRITVERTPRGHFLALSEPVPGAS